MRLWVNGEPAELPSGTTVADLIRARGHDPNRPGAAVAVDGEVVARGEWPDRMLEQDERVEVLGAVQGG